MTHPGDKSSNAARAGWNKGLWMGLIALTVISRWIYVFGFKINDLATEGSEYDTLAQGFLATGRYVWNYFGKDLPSAYMSPGVVGVLVAVKWIWPHSWFLALGAFQVILATVVLWMVRRVATVAFNEEIGWWTATLYAFDVNLLIPVAWNNETIYSLFFFSLFAVLLSQIWISPSGKRAAVCGAVLGVGALFRSTMLIQILPAAGWVFGCARAHGKSPWRHLVLFGATFGLLLLPWTLRNYRVFGKFIPISQNLGVNLWQGWNPCSAGSEYGWEGRAGMPTDPVLERRLRRATSESEINDERVRACWRWAKEDPSRWMEQRVLSFLWFWHEHNFWIPASTRPYPQRGWRIIGGIDLAFVLLFFVAVCLSVRQRGFHWVLLSILFVHCFVHTMIHGSIGSRFRYQVEPLMLPFVGFLAAGVLSEIKNRIKTGKPTNP